MRYYLTLFGMATIKKKKKGKGKKNSYRQGCGERGILVR